MKPLPNSVLELLGEKLGRGGASFSANSDRYHAITS